MVLGPGEKGRNRLALEPDAGTLTTRHYFETLRSAAADPDAKVRVAVEPIEDPGPPPTPSDASIAAGIRRVANYFRAATLDQPVPAPDKQPPWVSRVPNQFNAPDEVAVGRGRLRRRRQRLLDGALSRDARTRRS